MNNKIIALYEAHDVKALAELLGRMNVADIAEQLTELNEQVAVKVFRMLGKDKAAEVFAHLDRDTRRQIIRSITDAEVGALMDGLFVDDAVDVIEEMPAGVVTRILANVPAGKRETINQFLQYPDDSVGSIMTIEFVELKTEMTVREAFAHIRETGVDKETIYTCYVIAEDRRLLGIVTVRAMLLADFDAKIGDMMETDMIFAHTLEDQESLMAKFRKYDFIALPVVDEEDRLVGIVTVDDAFDVQEEEATEDFEIMAAMSPSETPYLKTSVFRLTKNRILWLLLLMLSATATGAIIAGFEDALAAVPALVAFIPMLMDTGGNAGSQSSTLIIRGMALEEIAPRDAGRVLWKEIRVAVLCGAVLVVVNYLRIVITGGTQLMALTVSLALYTTVVLAKMVGCLLPIVAKRLGADPAVMASPVITTIVDAASLAFYFLLASAILHI